MYRTIVLFASFYVDKSLTTWLLLRHENTIHKHPLHQLIGITAGTESCVTKHIWATSEKMAPSSFRLRYLGVLDSCSGGKSWQAMLRIGILFVWEGHVFPCLYLDAVRKVLL